MEKTTKQTLVIYLGKGKIPFLFGAPGGWYLQGGDIRMKKTMKWSRRSIYEIAKPQRGNIQWLGSVTVEFRRGRHKVWVHAFGNLLLEAMEKDPKYGVYEAAISALGDPRLKVVDKTLNSKEGFETPLPAPTRQEILMSRSTGRLGAMCSEEESKKVQKLLKMAQDLEILSARTMLPFPSGIHRAIKWIASCFIVSDETSDKNLRVRTEREFHDLHVSMVKARENIKQFMY